MSNVEITYIFKGSDEVHKLLIEMEINKTYPFSKTVDKVLNKLSLEYGWGSENISYFSIKLEDENE